MFAKPYLTLTYVLIHGRNAACLKRLKEGQSHRKRRISIKRRAYGWTTRSANEMPKKRDYKADLLADLRNDSAYAAQYLSAAKKDSRGAFLVALRDVAEARLGVSRIARAARVNR